MSHISRLKPIVHIGPPKTATTSLQEAIIPRLGRPYQIKPDWARALARNAVFEPPHEIEDDVIVSHESLGDFATFTPEVIAARLGQVFKDAVVVFVAREPLDLFYSLYRQRLINIVATAADLLARKGRVYMPNDVNGFFDAEFKQYRKTGTGFFRMLRFEANQAVFAACFDVQTIPFDLLHSKPRAFVSAFVDICGGGPAFDLPQANKTDTVAMEAALAASPLTTWPPLCERFLEFYSASFLSGDRADFVRTCSSTQNIEAFVKAFRFH